MLKKFLRKEGEATASRTSAEPIEAQMTAVKEKRAAGWPSTVFPFLVFVDVSGSMDFCHEQTKKLASDVVDYQKTIGGDRALNAIYICTVYLAREGILSSGFTRLRDAVDVPHTKDGGTPLGTAFEKGADELEEFIHKTLIAAGVRSAPPECLILSDLDATEETPEQTAKGIARLVEVVKKLRGRITVVGPKETMKEDVAKQLLAGTERKPLYLDAEPGQVLRIVLNTLSDKGV